MIETKTSSWSGQHRSGGGDGGGDGDTSRQTIPPRQYRSSYQQTINTVTQPRSDASHVCIHGGNAAKHRQSGIMRVPLVISSIISIVVVVVVVVDDVVVDIGSNSRMY